MTKACFCQAGWMCPVCAIELKRDLDVAIAAKGEAEDELQWCEAECARLARKLEIAERYIGDYDWQAYLKDLDEEDRKRRRLGQQAKWTPHEPDPNDTQQGPPA